MLRSRCPCCTKLLALTVGGNLRGHRTHGARSSWCTGSSKSPGAAAIIEVERMRGILRHLVEAGSAALVLLDGTDMESNDTEWRTASDLLRGALRAARV